MWSRMKLTATPLGPGRPLSPGKPRGPCVRRTCSTHFQIEQQILVSMWRQEGAVPLTIGPGAPFSPGAPDSPCAEESVARVTVVQLTAFSSHDFLAFFMSINTRWTMD